MATRYVNTASSAGGDGTTNATSGANRAYATQQEAETQLSGSSFAEDLYIECSGVASDVPATWDNTYVQGSYKVIVRYNSASSYGFHDGAFNENTYRMAATANSQTILTVTSTDEIEFIGIQLHTNGYTNVRGIYCANSTGSMLFKRSIILYEAGSPNQEIQQDSGSLTLENNIIAFRASLGGYASGSIYITGGSCKMYNCLIRGVGYPALASGGTIDVVNCQAYENGYNLSATSIDHCATDNGAGTNPVTVTGGWAAQFVYNNYSRRSTRYFLRSTSSLMDAGVGPSVDSNVPTEDMLGNSRSGSTATVGPFEGATTLPDEIEMFVNTASTDGASSTGLTNNTSGQDHAIVSLEKLRSYITDAKFDYDVRVKFSGAFNDTGATGVWTGTFVLTGHTLFLEANRDSATGFHGGKLNTGTYRHWGTSTQLYLGTVMKIVVDGLQFIAATSTHSVVYTSAALSPGSEIKNCIFNCELNGCNGVYVDAGANLSIHDNVIATTNASPGTYGIRCNNGTVNTYNNVVTRFSQAVSSGSGTHNVKNDIVFDNTDDFVGGITVIDHCASDDGDGTDPVSVSNWDDEFYNPNYATELDFRLSASSVLLGAGVGPNVDSDVPTEDILDYTREGDTASVGPFEYSWSGPPSLTGIDYRFINFATNSGFEDDGSHGIQVKVGEGILLDSSGISLDFSIIDQMYITEYTIQAADVTSKSITLTTPLSDTDQVSLTVFGGPDQNYGTDYTATGSTTLSWNGLGMDGSIAENDVIRLKYPR